MSINIFPSHNVLFLVFRFHPGKKKKKKLLTILNGFAGLSRFKLVSQSGQTKVQLVYWVAKLVLSPENCSQRPAKPVSAVLIFVCLFCQQDGTIKRRLQLCIVSV